MRELPFQNRISQVALIVLLIALGSEAAAREWRVHSGCCDGSAGAALNEELFVSANDEDNILRVYRRGQDGGPVAAFDVSEFLGIKSKSESDLEGAAKIGNRIYWITSHARDKAGKEQSSRHRFFATESDASGERVELKPAGRPYSGLLGDLLNEPALKRFNLAAASQREAKAPGGLNIEGLVATPEGHLLIGFRNPVPGGKALLVPLLNPGEMIEGAPARFGSPVLLDLGGLAVRSIAHGHGRYFIVAGPHDGKGRSRLYQWAGGSAPPALATQVDFTGLNPEGIAVFAEGILVLSDDGSGAIGGSECKKVKDPGARRFRSLWIEKWF